MSTSVRARANRILKYLKRVYPKPKSELLYDTPFQFVVAVILSAQCTDKAVNRVTRSLFKKYKSPKDFARAKQAVFEREINSIPFFRNKTRAILLTANDIVRTHRGKVPNTESELVSFHGIGYKTAHVILGELYEKWDGIPTLSALRFALGSPRIQI